MARGRVTTGWRNRRLKDRFVASQKAQKRKNAPKRKQHRTTIEVLPLTLDTENFLIPRGKHTGRTLGTLSDQELAGVHGAYNDMGPKYARLAATFKAEILRRRNALDTEYREIVATVQYTATDLRPPRTHAEWMKQARQHPAPREFYDAPQEEPPFDIDDTATGIG